MEIFFILLFFNVAEILWTHRIPDFDLVNLINVLIEVSLLIPLHHLLPLRHMQNIT